MNKEQRDIVGKALKHARGKAGLSQTEAGKAAGLTQAMMSQIERGKRDITPVEMKLLSKVYGGVELTTPGASPDAAISPAIEIPSTKRWGLSMGDRVEIKSHIRTMYTRAAERKISELFAEPKP